MDSGVGADAVPYGAGEAAWRGDNDDPHRAEDHQNQVPPGAVGVAPRYSVAEVERLAAIREWGPLEDYVMSFVPQRDRDLHPELLLLCRRGVLASFRGDGALGYFFHSIKPLVLFSKNTPCAIEEIFRVKVDCLQGSLDRGELISGLPDIADKVNDYMRFYFGETIGYPEPGEVIQGLRTFTFLFGHFANGQDMLRCILCQKKFKRGTPAKQYDMVHEHLKTTGECPGMNYYTWDRMMVCTGAKVGPVDVSQMPVNVNIPEKLAISGLAILKKMSSSGVNPAFIQLLKKCLHNLMESGNSDTMNTQILRCKEVLLDMMLDTNVPRQHCVDLRNWFTSVKFSENSTQHVPSSLASDDFDPGMFFSTVVPACVHEESDPFSENQSSQNVIEMVHDEKAVQATSNVRLGNEELPNWHDPTLPSYLQEKPDDVWDTHLVSDNEQ